MRLRLPKRDVVGKGAAGFKTNGLAEHESHGFGLGLADGFGGEGAALSPVQHYVALCCRQHKATYVAQRFMWRSLQDARKDALFGADKHHIT